MSEDFSVGVPTVNGRQNSTNCGDLFKKIRKNWIGKPEKCEVRAKVSLAGLNL